MLFGPTEVWYQWPGSRREFELDLSRVTNSTSELKSTDTAGSSFAADMTALVTRSPYSQSTTFALTAVIAIGRDVQRDWLDPSHKFAGIQSLSVCWGQPIIRPIPSDLRDGPPGMLIAPHETTSSRTEVVAQIPFTVVSMQACGARQSIFRLHPSGEATATGTWTLPRDGYVAAEFGFASGPRAICLMDLPVSIRRDQRQPRLTEGSTIERRLDFWVL